MIRRWIIRCIFVLPVLLCVVGWAWSVGHVGFITYYHDGYMISCFMEWGETELHWGQYEDGESHDWKRGVGPKPFRIVAPDFFATSTSCILGFYYKHFENEGLNLPSFDLKEVKVPFWFLIMLSSAVLFFVWRKTRPKINPKMAFPVEVVTPP